MEHAEPAREPRAPGAARRAEVRARGPAGFRLGARVRRASAIWTAATSSRFRPAWETLAGGRPRGLGPRLRPAGPARPAAPQAPLGRRPGAMTRGRPAIVLLSGGLDSATCLLIAREEGFEVHALSFDYGQRHAVELEQGARGGPALRRRRASRGRGSTFPAPGASALTDPGARGAPREPRPGRRSRSPTSRPATRSSWPTPWPGPRRSGPSTSSSAPTPSTTPATPTAGPSSSRPSSAWPTSAPRPASRAPAFRIRAPLLALTKGQIVARGAGARAWTSA